MRITDLFLHYPIFRNFFAKVMHNRLTEFAETYEILYCCQIGFRKNRSTSLALIHLINKISSAIDRHEIIAGVLFIMKSYPPRWNIMAFVMWL